MSEYYENLLAHGEEAIREKQRRLVYFMRYELLMAVRFCIEQGNVTGAYVYARMLARACDRRFWIEYLAENGGLV